MPEQAVHQSDAVSQSFTGELNRIRSAYEKRATASLYSMFEPAQMLAIHERESKLITLLKKFAFDSQISSAKILEIGCGSGIWLREFIRWGAQPENITGIDLLPERINEARRLSPQGVTLICQSATTLRDISQKFDLIMQSTVFTSILDSEMKRQIAKEMLTVLAPRGVIVWYDFRVDNPRNRDVRGIEKREINELFQGCSVRLERLTLAPPLARPLARLSPKLYRVAACVKPACTHYLGLIKNDQ
jgi:2-polyprenyl-3-methyl-5-hydroxy-6-metoxy-1,4-benzoquinol methylase